MDEEIWRHDAQRYEEAQTARSWWQIRVWIRRCCRICSQKTGKACRSERGGDISSKALFHQRTEDVRGAEDLSLFLSI